MPGMRPSTTTPRPSSTPRKRGLALTASHTRNCRTARGLGVRERSATEITAGHRTPYAKAKAIEQYLQAEYTYRFATGSANAGLLSGQDPIASFLFDSRGGTCGSFSSAFVMLARSVGIPARVVSGWAIEEAPGSQIIYTDQAHQWAEVPFAGLGWITFDPTPGGAPSRVPGSESATMPVEDSGTGADGQGIGDGMGGSLSAEDIASLATEDEEARNARLETLERQGAEVARLKTVGRSWCRAMPYPCTQDDDESGWATAQYPDIQSYGRHPHGLSADVYRRHV